MNILISSYAFSPSVGGIETVTATLASEFCRMGHLVRLITQTAASGCESFPYPVIRSPAPRTLWKLVKSCDVYWHNNISLRTAWPLSLTRSPWVVTTETWLDSAGEGTGWLRRIKLHALGQARNIYISRAVAAHVGLPGIIIPNPYDDVTFRLFADVPKDLDLVFVGRLVSDKGTDLLLHAVAQLANRGLRPKATIIGGGPEEAKLRDLATELHLANNVVFAGSRQGADLARLIARHRIMVVPSRWAEPFGVVALEGIACGCAVVGSAEGGLPDAIGPCGVIFQNGSADSLAAALAELLRDERKITALRSAATAHLANHSPEVIARQYLELFAQAANSRRS